VSAVAGPPVRTYNQGVMWARSVAVALLTTAVVRPADTPSVARLLAAGRSEAASSHKLVFVSFGASWCGWCHRLDKFIDTPEIHAILDKYFVRVYVDIEEQGDKESLNNPGGEELRARLGGKRAGVPFFAFLDSNGEMLVNSMRPAEGKDPAANIGYPNEPNEIDWFLTMLAKAVPAMPRGEASIIEQWLRSHSH
jgi:thiol-disulfide isomerase/thioredoxin